MREESGVSLSSSSGDRFCQSVQISIANRGLDMVFIWKIFAECGDGHDSLNVKYLLKSLNERLAS